MATRHVSDFTTILNWRQLHFEHHHVIRFEIPDHVSTYRLQQEYALIPNEICVFHVNICTSTTACYDFFSVERFETSLSEGSKPSFPA